MPELIALLRRDVQIYWHNKNASIVAVIFYIVVISMFALTSGIDAAVIFSAMLLATLLSLNTLLKTDYDLGVFEYLLLNKTPFSLQVLAKVLTHWLATQLPMLFTTMLFASNMPMVPLLFALLIGSLILSLITPITRFELWLVIAPPSLL